MIGVIVNPRAGYVAAHGLDHLQALIQRNIPDAKVHVLRPQDDIAARCQAFIAAGATCVAAAGGDGGRPARATRARAALWAAVVTRPATAPRSRPMALPAAG